MISAVILVFAFVTPAFTLPLTTQGQTTTGIEQTVGDYVKETFQSAESVVPNTPQVEKTEYQGTQKVYNQQQQQQQQQQPQPFETVGEKTGVQGSSQTYPHGVNTPVGNVGYHAGQEVYTQEKTSGADAVRPVSTYVEQVGAHSVPEVERRPESSVTPVSTHVEKSGTHATPAEYTNQQQPVLLPVNPDAFPKQVEPVNVAVPEPQQIVPVPITPGIQPLSVLPVPGNQIVNPIVVPTEGVTGRLIIMSIEPIQQRVFQPEAQNTVEKQVPQQVNQPVEYTPVQGQVVEPSNQQYLSAQNYVPENVEKQVPQQQPVQAVNEAFTPVQQQVAEHSQQQLYNVQPQVQANVAPVANNVEKQIPYHQETQASQYVPVQSQEVEPYQQQSLNAQQVVPQQPQIKTEQQLPYQQTQVQNTDYTPNTPYPAQKIQPAQQGIATHVPEHVPQNEHPKQSLPNQPAQSVQPLQTFSCIPAQTLSAASPNPQAQSVKPVSNTQN